MTDIRRSFHLREVGLPAIRPGGWLRHFLKLQDRGLTGHLEVAGFPFNTKLWACEKIEHQGGSPWWPYEQAAYWIDGLYRCGLLLDNVSLIDRGERQLDYVLEHVDSDGYLGPKNCKEEMVAGRWSHAVFFRALLAKAGRGDPEGVAKVLERHYLESPYDHSGHRDVCNIEIMAWVAEVLEEPKLVALAEETWERFLERAEGPDEELRKEHLCCDKPASTHGVTYCETVKQPAILYLLTGKEEYLDYSIQAFDKLDRYHMLVSGAPSSTEELRGTGPLDAHETCDIADYCWSAGYLLMATNEAKYADGIERACFNALPSAITKDFRALQYFSAPNQVILTNTSTHTLAAAGGKFMTYRPRPGTECCTAQVNRVLPNYVARQWMMHREGPVAACYGAGSFQFDWQGSKVSIEQWTDYPFEEEIHFTLRLDEPVLFSLRLRIPGWCERASLRGVYATNELEPGSWESVTRVWHDGDRLTLRLPMDIRLREWPEGGVTIERGPLVYALPIAEERSVDTEDKHQSEDFPAWEMRPLGSWNYGLKVTDDLLSRIRLTKAEEFPRNPWRKPPLRLSVPLHRVPGWEVNETQEMDSLGAELVDPDRNIWNLYPERIQGDFKLTPNLPSDELREQAYKEPEEWVDLVPLGCTLLRLTVLPKL